MRCNTLRVNLVGAVKGHGLEEIVTQRVFTHDPGWFGPFLRHGAELPLYGQDQFTFENKQLLSVPGALIGQT